MSYTHKPNRGSIFRNDKKQKDTDADYKGDAVINGQEVWINGWLNEGKNGKYLALSFNEKKAVNEQGMAQAKAAAAPTPPQDDFGDLDVPF